jgi:hypothetical protein
MKSRYVLAPEAARDLVGIWRYIKKQSSLEMAERVEGSFGTGSFSFSLRKIPTPDIGAKTSPVRP